MKKYCLYIFTIVCALALSGCSLFGADYSGIAGYSQVETARDLYTALDSGRLTIVDNSSGEITQDFVFKYEGDVLTYSYVVVDENEIYCEYHNGSEINYTTDKDEAWTALDATSEQYFVKSKTDRHPLTDRTAISINADSIVSGTVSEQADGGFVITYDYDIEKLASYATALETVGTLTGFATALEIDGEGYCTALTQTATFIDADGNELAVDYTMTITQMNSVESVTRPAAPWENNSEE